MFCVMFFAGCGSATQYSIYYADGSRSSEYQIAIDSTTCNQYNLDPNKVMSVVKYLATQQELYLKTYGIACEGVHITHGVSPTNAYLYGFNVTFDSFEDYCTFYGITQEQLDNQTTEIRPGLFVSQVIIQDSSTTEQNGNIDTSSLGVYLGYDAIKTVFCDQLFGGDMTLTEQFLDKITLNIVKCFPTQYGYRTNADEVTTAVLPAGVKNSQNVAYTAHLWTGTIATPPEQILIYRNFTDANNRLMWYLLTIGLTVIFGVILTIILTSKANKEDKLMQTINPSETTTIKNLDSDTTEDIQIQIIPPEDQNKSS